MKRVKELIAEIDRQIELLRSCCDGVEDFLADKFEWVNTQLKAAIAPDWKPASDPPDEYRECHVLYEDGSVGIDEWDAFYGWQRSQEKVTNWHEIEVPEPPEVGT